MKNFLLLLVCVFLTHALSVYAQDVRIEPVGATQNISAPMYDVLLGAFDVIITPAGSYHLDSCWLVIHGTIPQVIANLRFNRGDHPEHNPYAFWGSVQSNHLCTLGEIYNFPATENDTTRVEFTADIGVHVLPIVGSNISVSLQCSGFSLGQEEIVTNTAFGPVISISFINAISEIAVQQIPIVGLQGQILVLDAPIRIFDCIGQLIGDMKESGTLYVSPGIYVWKKDSADETLDGRIMVH